MDFAGGAQVLLGGLLTGCIYALVSVGLSLIWGLMGLINFAHGDFLMIGMYTSFWAWALFRIDPLFGLPLTGALLFVWGVLVYYGIVRRVLTAQRIAQVFATFGLGLALRSAAQFLWTPNYRMVDNPILGGVIRVGQVSLGKAHLVGGLTAYLLALGLYYMIMKTDIGRALSATSADKETAELMGIDTDKMFALGWGLGSACVGVGGALLASYYYIYPDVGLMFSTIASTIVALGGFGSIPGALVAALIVGVVQTSVSFFLAPALKLAMVYLFYLIVVVCRPQGLMGRW
ncbi:MAG: branched-chain amino acid ABC transporter permease [Bacillota bacterium]|nr:branched-chain amino acid ABC transporter permease [Bacillota bacterium]